MGVRTVSVPIDEMEASAIELWLAAQGGRRISKAGAIRRLMALGLKAGMPSPRD